MEYYLPLLVQYEPSLYLAIAQTSRYCKRMLNSMRPTIDALFIDTIDNYEQLQRRRKFNTKLLIINRKSRLLRNILSKVKQPNILMLKYATSPPVLSIPLLMHIDSKSISIGEFGADLYIYINRKDCVEIRFACSEPHHVYIYSEYILPKVLSYVSMIGKIHIYWVKDLPPHAMDVFNIYRQYLQN